MTRARRTLALGVAVAVSLSAAAAPAPAAAVTVTNGTQFTDTSGNRNSGKCLDVASASTADGANIIQYTCGSGTNQQWSRTQV